MGIKKLSPSQIALVVIAAILLFCICASSCAGMAYLLFRPKSPASPATQNPAPQTYPGNQVTVDPSQQTWLVMLYFDADDPVLEEDILFDLNEAELIGSNDRVTIVAQIDRYSGGYSGDGNWTGTRRYLVTQDDDLERINSQLVEDLGEVDMDKPGALLEFATWAIQRYPANKYVLIMSDHGMGWPGGWFDPDPLDIIDDYINLQELGVALRGIVKKTGISSFDLVGMDACLMSMLEVYTALAPYASYAVASQEVEPALGWAYSHFLGALTNDPAMSTADLASLIVEGYIDQDQRILDENARARYLASFGVSEPYSAGELAQELKLDATIAAIDLGQIGALNANLDLLLVELKDIDQGVVAQARSYAQPFENIFSDQYPSPYIDLFHFAGLVAELADDGDVDQTAQQLQNSLQNAVIAEKHGEQRAASYGISIFFPVSDLYWDEYSGVEFYTSTASLFADETLWDDFLAYHYAGQDFGLGNPSRDARLPAPGSAQVTISNVKIANPIVSSSNPIVNIQADITGDQIAYIYIVAMFSYQNDYLAIAMDYVMGDQSIEYGGIVYPTWNRKNGVIHISLNYPLRPTGICDGNGTCFFAFLQPSAYNPDPSKILYYSDGLYTFTDTNLSVESRMYFFNYGQNRLRNIVGYFSDSQTGAPPSNITPRIGDQFTFADIWWEANEDGERNTVVYEGQTLQFGGNPLYWGVHNPDPGDYVIGIWVEDMDGKFTQVWAPVTVTK